METILDWFPSVIIGLVISVLLGLVWWRSRLLAHPALPSPPLRWWELMGHASILRGAERATDGGNPQFALVRAFNRYSRDGICVLRSPGLPGWMLVCCDDRELAQRINAQRDLFAASPMLLDGYGSLVPGLLGIDGPVWRTHRAALAPCLGLPAATRMVMDADAELIRGLAACRTLRNTTARGGVVELDIDAFLSAVVMDAAMRSLVGLRGNCVGGLLRRLEGATEGAPLEGDLEAEWKALTLLVNQRVVTPRWMWGSTIQPAVEAAGIAALHRLRRLFGDAIGTAGEASAPTVLQLCQQGSSPSSSALTREEWLTEAILVTLGTIETVSHAVAWALVGLLRADAGVPVRQLEDLYEWTVEDTCWRTADSPRTRWRALESEVGAVAGWDIRAPVSMEQLQACVTLEGVAKESLRLYSPIHGTVRQTQSAVELNGHVVPAGVTIAMLSAAMHTNPSNFPEPFRFAPERWADPGSPLRGAAGAFNAFGGGPKMCLGARQAVGILKLSLLRLVQAFQRVEVAPDAPRIHPTTLIATVPASGVLLRLTPRNPLQGSATN